MKEKKVAFFIDDDKQFLETLSLLVQHPLFEVRTYCAKNGYQAVDELLKTRPDVVFIDFYIPRANGGQIISIVKSAAGLEHLPVYFLTVYSKDAVSSFLRHFEFDGILEKEGHFVEEIIKILDQLAGPARSEAVN